MATVSIRDNPTNTTREIVIHIERQFDARTEASIIRDAMKDAAQQVTGKWIEENRDKIYERLNVDAIANMIMLEVTKNTKDDILRPPNN